jgi:hypothetical protein
MVDSGGWMMRYEARTRIYRHARGGKDTKGLEGGAQDEKD